MSIKAFNISTIELGDEVPRVQVRAKAGGYASSIPSEAVYYIINAVMRYNMARAVSNDATATVDMSLLELAAGTYSVRAGSRAEGFIDSALSEAVSYVVRSIIEGTLFSADGYALTDSDGIQLIAKGG